MLYLRSVNGKSVVRSWDPTAVNRSLTKLNKVFLGQLSIIFILPSLTFRHRASCMSGEAFHYSPENAFYIFNQQIYFII